MAFNNFYLGGKNLLKYISSLKITKLLLYFIITINCTALLILSFVPANNSIPLYKFLYKNDFQITKIYTVDKIPYKKSGLLINFYRNKDIYFTKITDVNECDKLGKEIEIANKVNITNYNKETPISEIQKFSFPKWTFEYSIQCNKKTYFDNFKLDKKKYFLIHKFKYYDFFYNNEEYNCRKIYSTLPSWLIESNVKNLLKNISSWHIFECNINT